MGLPIVLASGRWQFPILISNVIRFHDFRSRNQNVGAPKTFTQPLLNKLAVLLLRYCRRKSSLFGFFAGGAFCFVNVAAFCFVNSVERRRTGEEHMMKLIKKLRLGIQSQSE